MSTTRGLLQDDGFGVGNCISGKIEISLYPFDKNGNVISIPKMAMLLPSYAVANNAQISEFIPKGVYFIDTRSVDQDTGLLSLVGYDAMLKAEADYPLDGNNEYPLNDRTVVSVIANAIGVEVDQRTYSVVTGEYNVPLPVNYSCREVLSGIGTSYGANFCITDEGKLLAISANNVVSDPHYLADESGNAITIGGVRIIV
jgi:hypothetical protein